MGDLVRGSTPGAAKNLSQYITTHPGQLSLAIPPWVGAMSTSQKMVMPCGWVVKAGMVREWVAGQTVWSPCYHGSYLSAHGQTSIQIASGTVFQRWGGTKMFFVLEHQSVECVVRVLYIVGSVWQTLLGRLCVQTAMKCSYCSAPTLTALSATTYSFRGSAIDTTSASKRSSTSVNVLLTFHMCYYAKHLTWEPSELQQRQ